MDYPSIAIFAFPAEAGIHVSADGEAANWVPAFAGNAVR
jgi:hypothetical protein